MVASVLWGRRDPVTPWRCAALCCPALPCPALPCAAEHAVLYLPRTPAFPQGIYQLRQGAENG